MITEPTVTLWAETNVTDGLLDWLPFDDDVQNGNEVPHENDHLAEAAGRACYQSQHRPNAKTRLTKDYLAHILELRHHSVLAHASVTLYLEGVSRSLTHELIRSRFLAFSELSQRYVDAADIDWVVPPLALFDSWTCTSMDEEFERARSRYVQYAARLESIANELFATKTERRKRAREAARAILPNSAETKIVVSANLRAWRDFLEQRLPSGADLEIQRLAVRVLDTLAPLAPATFADLVTLDQRAIIDDLRDVRPEVMV